MHQSSVYEAPRIAINPPTAIGLVVVFLNAFPSLAHSCDSKSIIQLIESCVAGYHTFSKADAIATQQSAIILAQATPPLRPREVPLNQREFLLKFAEACKLYDEQINQIRKSEVFRKTERYYSDVQEVRDWVGILTRISTTQGGDTASLTIQIGRFSVFAQSKRGTHVYNVAAGMRTGQQVTFSGKNLQDFNLTERGKVCEPDFRIELTDLRPGAFTDSGSSANAQKSNHPFGEFSDTKQGRRLVALYNMTTQGDCYPQQYSGTIVAVNYDEKYATTILGFTLADKDDYRRYFNFETPEVGYVILEAIPFLIRKGRRVRVSAFACGAAGRVLLTNHIVDLDAASNVRSN